MDEVRRNELREKRGEDIGEEDEAFGNGGTDEVDGCREDDNVGDIVDDACEC